MEHDPDRVTKLASEIRRALRVLRALGELDTPAFVEDDDKVGNAKYKLIVAIEGCLDIANHLVSANGFRMPENYADTFVVLAENDVIDTEFAEELGAMARFRNRLVHIYWDVDDAQVHRFLRRDLKDIERFLETVLASL